MSRSRFRGALPWAAALLPLVALAAGLRSYGEAWSPGNTLQIDPARLSFGEVAAQKDYVLEVPVVNTGDVEVHVTGISTSCVCTRVEPASFRAQPGVAVTLRVHLDLSPKSEQDLSKAVREVQHELRFELEGFDGPGPVWSLRGQVANPYEVSPAFVQFDEQLIAGSDFPACELTVLPRAEVRTLEAQCDPRWASVQTIRQADGGYRVRIQPNPALPVGTHQFQVELAGINGAGEPLARQPVPVLAHVVGDILTAPRAVSYGLLGIGDRAEREIVFSSRTGRTLELIDMRAPEGLEVAAEPSPSQGAVRIRLVARPTRRGLQSGLVQFSLRDAAGNRHEVELRTSLEVPSRIEVNTDLSNQISR